MLLPPLNEDDCELLDHPKWREVLGGYVCFCGKFELEYHVSRVQSRREPLHP